MSNLLDIQQHRDPSNHWRNVLSMAALAIAIGGLVLWHDAPENSAEQFLARTFPVAAQKTVATGGDIVVAPPAPLGPEKVAGASFDPNAFDAAALLVKDHASGKVLAAKAPYTVRPIASITKLMSALVILEQNPDWATSTRVVGADGLGTHVYADDVYVFEDLWKAALVGSSNKAILSMAAALDWPVEVFVARMNQKARELGLSDTHFTDPTGLDATDVSTPSDILLLLNEALRHERIRDALLTAQVDIATMDAAKTHHMWNTNWLLLNWVPHEFAALLGGKTGYIPASGYNFTTRLADEQGHVLDVVVLGAPYHEARFSEARDVAEWVFESYQWEDEDVVVTTSVAVVSSTEE